MTSMGSTLLKVCIYLQCGHSLALVVAAEGNPLLWKLLKRVSESGPTPMLVNTSFNLFGEPLVITPGDALRNYYRSGGGTLVAGSFRL